MILYDIKFDKNLHLEIVDGKDIIKTYQNGKFVRSCMTYDACNLAKWYSMIPDCRLVRLLDISGWRHIVALRALLWLATTEKGEPILALDRVYSAERSTIGYKKHHGLMRDFLQTWKDNVSGAVHDRGGFPRLYINVPEKLSKMDKPYFDSLSYYREYNKLANFNIKIMEPKSSKKTPLTINGSACVQGSIFPAYVYTSYSTYDGYKYYSSQSE